MKQKIIFIVLIVAILASHVCNLIHYNKGEASFELLSAAIACIFLYFLPEKREEEFKDPQNIALNINLILSAYILINIVFSAIGMLLAIVGALFIKLLF